MRVEDRGVGNNPGRLPAYIRSDRRKGVNSSQIVKLLHEVYGERRIDGSPGCGRIGTLDAVSTSN